MDLLMNEFRARCPGVSVCLIPVDPLPEGCPRPGGCVTWASCSPSRSPKGPGSSLLPGDGMRLPAVTALGSEGFLVTSSPGPLSALHRHCVTHLNLRVTGPTSQPSGLGHWNSLAEWQWGLSIARSISGQEVRRSGPGLRVPSLVETH